MEHVTLDILCPHDVPQMADIATPRNHTLPNTNSTLKRPERSSSSQNGSYTSHGSVKSSCISTNNSNNNSTRHDVIKHNRNQNSSNSAKFIHDISTIPNSSIVDDVMRRHPPFFMSLPIDDRYAFSDDVTMSDLSLSDYFLNEARFYSSRDERQTSPSNNSDTDQSALTHRNDVTVTSSLPAAAAQRHDVSLAATNDVHSTASLNTARFVNQLSPTSVTLNDPEQELPCHINDISFTTNQDPELDRKPIQNMVTANDVMS